MADIDDRRPNLANGRPVSYELGVRMNHLNHIHIPLSESAREKFQQGGVVRG